MKVLVLATSYTRYNADYAVPFVHALNKQLAKNHDVSVVSCRGENSKSYEVLDGVKIFRFGYFFSPKLEKLIYHGGMMEAFKSSFLAKLQLPFYMLAFYLKSFNKILKVKPDVIHAHWSLSAFIAVLLKPIHRKPIILTVHGADIRSMPRLINKFVLKNVDRVVTAHSELIELMNEMGYNKTIDIKNMFDYEKFENKSKELSKEFNIGDSFVVSFIGRLVEMKDPINFLKAAKILKDENVKFILVGTGNLEKDVKSFIEKEQLSNVIFTGPRSDTEKIYSISNVFTALSPLENCFSTTIIEAMYSKVPCIITDAGKTKDHFTHNKDSYIIPAKNPQELVNAIKFFMNNNSDKIVNGADQFLKKNGFLPDEIMHKMDKVYKEL